MSESMELQIRHCTVSCPTHATNLIVVIHEDGAGHDHAERPCGEIAAEHLAVHPDCVLAYRDETETQAEERREQEHQARVSEGEREAEAIRRRRIDRFAQDFASASDTERRRMLRG